MFNDFNIKMWSNGRRRIDRLFRGIQDSVDPPGNRRIRPFEGQVSQEKSAFLFLDKAEGLTV